MRYITKNLWSMLRVITVVFWFSGLIFFFLRVTSKPRKIVLPALREKGPEKLFEEIMGLPWWRSG